MFLSASFSTFGLPKNFLKEECFVKVEKVLFKGELVTFKIAREDFSKQEPLEGVSFPELTSLVMFNKKEDTVIVDDGANYDYALYAGLHESICCGKYKYLAPETSDPLDKCGAIDKMILEEMPSELRSMYLSMRIRMFKTLLERNLNERLNPMFERALKILEEVTL